jgi:UDP-N-acetylmuramoylalanine--D-glutamate ligase
VAEVCRVLGIPEDVVAEGLRTFAGVEHRLEVAADRDGVRWVNDSKATNVASTLVALDAFADDRVHLIVGGDDAKAEDFSPLRPGAERAAGVYLIGEAEGRLLDTLGRGIPCGTLDAAVDEARRLAQRGDVVLLSPACASYDQFRDYEERGRRFKELVG